MAESEQFGGPNPVGKAPEKSNFSQACSLLSQYLKGQRSLADLGLGMPKENQEAFRPSVTTMNLLTHMESPSENGNQNAVVEPPGVKPAGLFPQFGGFGPSGSVEDVNKAEFRKSTTVEPETSQMTIFYAGQVLVFNDFPADKAKEILALAGKTTSNVSAAVFVPPTTSIPPPPPPPPLCMDKAEPRKPLAPPEPSPVAIPEKSSNHDQSPQGRPEANDSELPIARRASLHRFLEKRKDRVAAKAPYQVNHRAIAAPPKPEEGQNSNQLDLKL